MFQSRVYIIETSYTTSGLLWDSSLDSTLNDWLRAFLSGTGCEANIFAGTGLKAEWLSGMFWWVPLFSASSMLCVWGHIQPHLPIRSVRSRLIRERSRAQRKAWSNPDLHLISSQAQIGFNYHLYAAWLFNHNCILYWSVTSSQRWLTSGRRTVL